MSKENLQPKINLAEAPKPYFNLFHQKRVFLSSIVHHNPYVEAVLNALRDDQVVVGQRILPFDGEDDILLRLKSGDSLEDQPIPWNERIIGSMLRTRRS